MTPHAHSSQAPEGVDDEGPMVPVTDMVLGDGGPALFEAQRQHLEALRASPLRLYRVEQVAGAHRMIVRDVLDPTTPLEVKQGAWAGEFWAGNLRGMRLLPGVPPEPSGALFPYPDALADEVVGSIREAVAALRGVPSIHAPGYDERKFVAKTIISTWLMFLVGPLPEARARSTERKHTDRKGRRLRAARDPFIVDGGSGDPALLVTDRYEVRDWDRLAGALAAQPEVEGSRQHGWERRRIDSNPSRGPNVWPTRDARGSSELQETRCASYRARWWTPTTRRP